MVCRYSKIDAACEVLSGCDRLWRQTSKGYTSDWKRNAGASTIMQRVPVTLSRRRMPYLKSNFVPWVFASDGLMLAFYLDRLYIWDGKQYDAVDYADMEIDASLSHYREQEQVPRDATVLHYTWRFVRVDGGPDRRFNNNQQIPVTLYAHLKLLSKTGMNVEVIFSNSERGVMFCNVIGGCV